MATRKLTHADYTVGWICPVEEEEVAAVEMLDREQLNERLPQSSADHNSYTLRSIGRYNVVIATLPTTSNSAAATVVAHMKRTFKNIKYGLLVGIGGGVPTTTDNGHIRLGHVVVGKPANDHSGTVQYDKGKAEVDEFRRTGAINQPPNALIAAAKSMGARRKRVRDDPVLNHLRRIDTTIPLCSVVATQRLKGSRKHAS